ncbi:hypothetical protein QBC43DRAFT_317636 [Cladorrhinum sp. PSN259]|nr:hypothetical protein QBC43DRAFT_317636 [Cladorrhinum sp. PSN259]
MAFFFFPSMSCIIQTALFFLSFFLSFQILTPYRIFYPFVRDFSFYSWLSFHYMCLYSTIQTAPFFFYFCHHTHLSTDRTKKFQS